MYEQTMSPQMREKLKEVSYMSLLTLKNGYRFPKTFSDQKEYIIETVCNWFGVTKEQLEARCRKRMYVEPRQICMFLMSKYTKLTLKEIAFTFGGRDHTTALHSISTVEDLMDSDPEYRMVVQAIEIKIL